MKADEIYGSAYMNAAICEDQEIEGRPLTISGAYEEEFSFTDDTGKERKDRKIVLEFKGIDYDLPLNKTSATTIMKRFGNETDWS